MTYECFRESHFNSELESNFEEILGLEVVGVEVCRWYKGEL